MNLSKAERELVAQAWREGLIPASCQGGDFYRALWLMPAWRRLIVLDTLKHDGWEAAFASLAKSSEAMGRPVVMSPNPPKRKPGRPRKFAIWLEGMILNHGTPDRQRVPAQKIAAGIEASSLRDAVLIACDRKLLEFDKLDVTRLLADGRRLYDNREAAQKRYG